MPLEEKVCDGGGDGVSVGGELVVREWAYKWIESANEKRVGANEKRVGAKRGSSEIGREKKNKEKV